MTLCVSNAVCAERLAADDYCTAVRILQGHCVCPVQSALIGLRLMKSHKRPFTILKGVNGAIKPVRPWPPLALPYLLMWQRSTSISCRIQQCWKSWGAMLTSYMGILSVIRACLLEPLRRCGPVYPGVALSADVAACRPFQPSPCMMLALCYIGAILMLWGSSV